MTCTATGTAGDGQYANLGTVNATDLLNLPVSDDDPSHYIGLESSIDIEKSTNGDDADTPTGPFIPVDDVVNWTYDVDNTGDTDLSNILAVDYRAGGGFTQLTCPFDTLAPGASMTCTIPAGTAVAGQFVNYSAVIALDEFNTIVSDYDPSHYFGSDPDVQVEKYTNGIDADDPPGAFIEAGQAVEWTYVVTNTGNDTLTNIVVTDDQEGSVTCADTTLVPGESTDCTLDAGTSIAVRGQYANEATVTADPPVGPVVTDTDPSHYFGYVVDINVEKATNGEDADTPTGPVVGLGSTVTWTYVLTNPGDVPLLDVTVTDDQGVTPAYQGGDTNADGKLDPGETWTYEATGAAALGQYANVATATGLSDYELDITATDTDPSHYLGVEAAIQIEKTPDLAEVPRGDPHIFTIEVTNTGTVPLTDVEVTDPVTPACDTVIGDMAAGEVVTYECEVAAVLGVIDNTAFVEGFDPQGGTVEDQDDARVIPVQVGGTGSIGDTVWRDTNANGVQDPGEPGIAGARVTLFSSTFGTTETAVTDAEGHYLLPGLVADAYTVTLDLSSVTGTLTTPGVYTVDLTAGEEYLDADFGLVLGDLPFTGSEPFRIVLLALALVTAGAGVLLTVRYGTRVVRTIRA